MPSISERGRQVPASPIRKLAPLALEASAHGVKVISLNIGQPDLPTPPEAIAALHRINRKVLEYSPSDGLSSLRAKIAEYYSRFNLEVTPNQIIVTAGGSEAIMFAFLATLNPGDEIITPEPTYANYVTFTEMAGGKLVGVPSKIEDGFKLPPIEEFEKKITPRTKGILICNPNNPTGYVYTHEELEVLAKIVKKHDIYLFCDEVYREFCYTGHYCASSLSLTGIDDKIVVFDSMSKRYSECGIRIGNLVVRNRELHDTIMKFCQARLSPPLLGQIVAQASIDASPQYLQRCFNEYKRRRDFLIEGLNKIPGVYSPMPEGAFYTVASLPVENAEEFCKWCLKEFHYRGTTVFMAPAEGFYTTPGLGRNQVRIAYVIEEHELAEGLEVLREALEAYNNR